MRSPDRSFMCMAFLPGGTSRTSRVQIRLSACNYTCRDADSTRRDTGCKHQSETWHSSEPDFWATRVVGWMWGRAGGLKLLPQIHSHCCRLIERTPPPPPTAEFLHRECFFFYVHFLSYSHPPPFHVLLTLTFTNDIFVSEDTNTMRWEWGEGGGVGGSWGMSGSKDRGSYCSWDEMRYVLWQQKNTNTTN